MPNWCEGTIKIRGKADKVENFLVNGVNRYVFNFETMKDEVLPKEECVSVYRSENNYTEIQVRDVYIEGTRRAFIDDLYFYYDNDFDDGDVCAVGSFRQAWCIDEDVYGRLSDKYDVDLRLYGIECGMEFCEEVIAERGKPVVKNYIEYGDWQWECPFPNMGG